MPTIRLGHLKGSEMEKKYKNVLDQPLIPAPSPKKKM